MCFELIGGNQRIDFSDHFLLGKEKEADIKNKRENKLLITAKSKDFTTAKKIEKTK